MPRLDYLIAHCLGIKRRAVREMLVRGDLTATIRDNDDPAHRIDTVSPSWICLATDSVELQRRHHTCGVTGDDSTPPLIETIPLTTPFHRLVFMHKPPGMLSERREGVCNVYDAIPPDLMHPLLGVFGRLDCDTTGLLVLGTDGGLCHLATDPRTHLDKVYTAVCQHDLGTGRGSDDLDVPGLWQPDRGGYQHAIAQRAFASGIRLKDGTQCQPALLEWDLSGDLPVARITLSEGKYHQVKRMLGAVGAHVVSLHRESIGTVSIASLNLALGDVREATESEMQCFCAMFPLTRDVRDHPDRGNGSMADV
eukprot:m.51038 g.51038  ORF g.51038 m.51038 type:complete len:309 (+) comp7281_c0_seq1:191-1117(+)